MHILVVGTLRIRLSMEPIIQFLLCQYAGPVTMQAFSTLSQACTQEPSKPPDWVITELYADNEDANNAISPKHLRLRGLCPHAQFIYLDSVRSRPGGAKSVMEAIQAIHSQEQSTPRLMTSQVGRWPLDLMDVLLSSLTSARVEELMHELYSSNRLPDAPLVGCTDSMQDIRTLASMHWHSLLPSTQQRLRDARFSIKEETNGIVWVEDPHPR